ncbi:MAG: GNAT family N-acetyltransferase [Nitrospirae bacterium]|nr:GNAT family N-acetyltransferase [Nitrospirota bacterium]
MPRHTSSLSSSHSLSSTPRRKTLSRLLSASHISTQKGLSCPRYTRYPASQPVPITSSPIQFTPHKPGSANIGFVFFPQYWGNGYATEALLAVIGALRINGISSMRATVATPNIASAHVLEKAGFVRGNLVADEIDTYEFTLTLPKEVKPEAQSNSTGDAPMTARRNCVTQTRR